MKKFMPLFLTALLAVACNSIDGQLNVTKEFKLLNLSNQQTTINLGSYNADIQVNSKNRLTLRLNKDNNQKYNFNFNGNIPSNGTFEVPSNVSGQPVDLSGVVNTKISETPLKQTYQTCTYQIQYCQPGPQGPICGIQTVWGRQWITSFDRITEKNITLLVRAVGTKEDSADFHGDVTYVDNIIMNQSPCM